MLIRWSDRLQRLGGFCLTPLSEFQYAISNEIKEKVSAMLVKREQSQLWRRNPMKATNIVSWCRSLTWFFKICIYLCFVETNIQLTLVSDLWWFIKRYKKRKICYANKRQINLLCSKSMKWSLCSSVSLHIRIHVITATKQRTNWQVNKEKPMYTGQICIPHQNYKSFALKLDRIERDTCVK